MVILGFFDRHRRCDVLGSVPLRPRRIILPLLSGCPALGVWFFSVSPPSLLFLPLVHSFFFSLLFVLLLSFCLWWLSCSLTWLLQEKDSKANTLTKPRPPTPTSPPAIQMYCLLGAGRHLSVIRCLDCTLHSCRDSWPGFKWQQ